jgi:hypothetical protein
MARLHDWQTRFAEFARGRRDLPFAWGSNDCCLFAADCVEAMTGEDPAKDLRGYSTALQAARIVRAHGGMASFASSRLGPQVSPLMANVGDVVLVDMNGRDALGVCNGTSVIGPGPLGMVSFGFGVAKAAWRIG